MEKTVCELFAGVGGFRCGLNQIHTIEDTKKNEKWKTVWFNQWEPADHSVQWAHDCYVNRFGTCLDLAGKDTTNYDINKVNKKNVPDHNLLVGGFPCQDYSVASSLATSKGIEGKKGVLWWDIRDMLEAKGAPFVLLENVDRLIKSPAKQRGRDFGIILACFRDLGYTVEWRVINAAEYGFQQRRRRTFIFAYKNSTKYADRLNAKVDFDITESEDPNKNLDAVFKLLESDGFFAGVFPVKKPDEKKISVTTIPTIGEVSERFTFGFENTGIMKDGKVYTIKTYPLYEGNNITIGDIIEKGDVDESFFIPKDQLYYTDPSVNHSDESEDKLPSAARHTWQYLKGGKKIKRRANNGHEYVFSEGPISMVDEYDKPARTMLTSEGNFSRTTHIVRDYKTQRIRLLTPIEMERIQGFPSDWTKECLVNGKLEEMPTKKRRFMMGNALVVNLIEQMEKSLSDIFEKES